MWCPGDVVGAFDGAFVALSVFGGDLFHDVFDPDVEEEGPFAGFADADQPCLEGVVFVVGDFVFADGVVDGVEDFAGEEVDAFLGGVDRVSICRSESLGRVGAGFGGGRCGGVGCGGHGILLDSTGVGFQVSCR